MTTEHRQQAPTFVRGVNTEARTVDIIASDFSLDSYGTRIDPNGWDLEQFKKNPVICLQHDSYDDLPVANAIPETIRIENEQLKMTVQFPPEGTSEDSDKAFKLIAAGVLRGVSVGFDPSEWSDEEEKLPDGKILSVRVYRKQRLMEVSFVTIPSNDNGLVVRSRELNQDAKALKAIVREMEDRMKDHQKEIDAKQKLEAYKPSHLLLAVGYMERKQPANKIATKVLERFFEKILKREQPAEEVEAWGEMRDAIEMMAEVPEEKKEEEGEPVVVTEVETSPETVVPEPETPAEPTEPTNPTPAAAPQDERTAFVQIPASDLAEFASKLTRSLTDVGVEALRRGIPIKDACKLIDGTHGVVSTSISHISHGHNSRKDAGGTAV